MVPSDALRHAARRLARRDGLDRAAEVMVGAIAATGRLGGVSPSAEERAELVSIAGDADGCELFIEAATSRALQFAASRWELIEAAAERLAPVQVR